MKTFILILFISTSTFGSTDVVHRLECRQLNGKDYERLWRTKNCIQKRGLSSVTLTKQERPIKITIGKKFSSKIEDGETTDYKTNWCFKKFSVVIKKIIPSVKNHEMSFFKSCEEEGMYYGAGTLYGSGPILDHDRIPAAYFIECVKK